MPPAAFEALPARWRQVANGGTLTRRGANAETIATSWRYHRSPYGPAGNMPKGGVIVAVLLIRRRPGKHPPVPLCNRAPRLRSYPPIRHLPPRLPSKPAGTLEGYEKTPEYQLFGAIRNDYNVEIRIAINQPDPSRILLRQAEAALDQLRFPDWPNHC